MREIGENGELVFSSTEFGEGSVMKTEEIAKILSDLLTNITIHTESKDIEILLEDYYNRQQIDQMLTQYVTLTILAREVADQLNAAISDPEFRAQFASHEELEALQQIISTYDSTIATIEGNQRAIQAAQDELKRNTEQSISMQNQMIAQQTNLINTLQSSVNSLSGQVTTLQSIIENLNLLDLAQINQRLADIDSRIGDLSNLRTTIKFNLVGAINELVGNIGSLSGLQTTAKDSLVAAINELFQSASEGKRLIAAAITGKGIDAAATESFQSLASKIDRIQVGYDTSDANITAADITLGKIGYGANGRLVGEHADPEPDPDPEDNEEGG